MRFGLSRIGLRLAAKTEEGRELLRSIRADILARRNEMSDDDPVGFQKEIAEGDGLIRSIDKSLAKYRIQV